MLHIAGGILLAIFILWVLKWVLFAGGCLHTALVGDTTPEMRAQIQAQKDEWQRLKAARTPHAESVLLPRLSPEERSSSSYQVSEDAFPADFCLPSPELPPTRSRR